MGQPVTLTRTPSTIARSAPKRGEHSEEILAEVGYDREALAAPESRRSLLMNDMTYPSTTERVKTWLEGPVLHIRFNNPAKHNALSVDMWEAVPPLLQQAEKDDNVRMVVFSGEGGKSFVSGADISQFEDMRAQQEAVKRYELMAEAALAGHLRVRQAHGRVHPAATASAAA